MPYLVQDETLDQNATLRVHGLANKSAIPFQTASMLKKITPVPLAFFIPHPEKSEL